MEPALAALYAKVADRVPQHEFEQKVRDASAQFGGLLDDEALGLLVLDEMGLNEGAYATLDGLKGRTEATVRVRVERIDPPRTFERPGRDDGRVVNVAVADATGDTKLVFWDKDADRADELRAGMHLTVVNARVKEGRFGLELHVGPWSVLEIEGALDPARAKLLADVRDASAGAPASPTERTLRQATLPTMEELPTTIEGKLDWVSPTRPVHKDGATSFACDVDIATPAGMRRIVAWDHAVKAARALAPGVEVRASDLAPKVKGAATEWHTTPATRLEPR